MFERNAKDKDSPTSEEVKQQWEIIKATERTERERRKGSLSGLPSHLPSLLHADRIGRRASVVGFDWQSIDDVDTKITEEFEELGNIAKSKGFLLVSSSPLTRSSYHADEDFALLQKNRINQTNAQSVS